MTNIFALPFQQSRPFTSNQYINAFFQHAISITNDASKDDIQILKAIAENTKASQEYHQMKEMEKTQTKMDMLTQELEEKSYELDCLKNHAQNTDGTTNQQHSDLQKHIFQLENELNDQNHQIENLTQHLAQKTEEVEHLRRYFREGIQREVENAEIPLKKEIARLNDLLKDGAHEVRKRNDQLESQVLEQSSEISNLRENNKRLLEQIADLEFERNNYERIELYSPEQIDIIEKRMSNWRKERQALVDDCNNRMREAGVFDIQKLQNEMETLRRGDVKRRNESEELKARIDDLRYNKATLISQLDRMHEDKNDLFKKLEDSNNENKTLIYKLEQAMKKIDMLNDHIDHPDNKKKHRPRHF